MSAFVYEPVSVKKRSILLDTDIGPDCDDAGALAVLYSLRRQYGFRVAGIVNCTSNPYGNGALEAICRFCGDPDVRIGMYEKPGFLADCTSFNRYLSERMSPAFAEGRLQVLPALELYRRVLNEAEDDGIILVTIGQFNVLSELLQSEALLIERKVHALVSMAGCFPSGREYNIYCAAAAAKTVFDRFPKPILCSGFEVGETILTGFPAGSDERLEDNPVFMAYKLYTEGKNMRSSWDPATVHYAIEADERCYRLSGPGRVTVEADGSNRFTPSAEGTHYYIIKSAPDEELADRLNSLIRR